MNHCHIYFKVLFVVVVVVVFGVETTIQSLSCYALACEASVAAIVLVFHAEY